MNAIVTARQLSALPERATLPAPSQALNDAVWAVSRDLAPTDDARSEAKLLLEKSAPMFAPPKHAQVRNWLERINLGASQPISVGDFDVRSAVIIDAMQTFPAAVFTAETAREAALKFKWFPGAAELAEFLAGPTHRVRNLERDMARVAESTIAPPVPRTEPTQAERDAVATAVRAATGRGLPQNPVRTVAEQLAALSATP